MSSSDKNIKSAMSVWRFFIFISLVYAASLFLAHRTALVDTVYWSGYNLQVLNENGIWKDGNRMDIGNENKTQEILFSINIDDSDKWKQPISLRLGGPFSAQVLWDGENIGNKGTLGNNNSDGVAGPIDFSLFVPSRLLHAGIHQLQIRISTQHLLMRDNSILHFVLLTPYQHNGQRDLRYYALPLVILSGLIILSIQSFRIGQNAGNIVHTGLGIYGFFIILTLITELSRAIVNYPYHYHELRSVIGWWSLIGAGFTLIYICHRVVCSNFSKALLALGIIAVLINNFFPMKSEDLQLAIGFILLVLASSLTLVPLLMKKRFSYLSTLPIFCLACLISAKLSIGLFLDSFLFIGSLIIIGGAWSWTYVAIPKETSNQNSIEKLRQLTIKSKGEDKLISVADCYALKAEGNFTSVMLLDGSSILHQDGLGAIIETKPANFVRVHKSFAINLNAVVAIKSAVGSKYWLEMKNQEKIPISRYRVAELRGLLNHTNT